ncbi:MAG TPA: hypothetical protein VMQ73_04910 [Methylomirabilota bacterium]|nr:hypothetical protein [Methylomirabilota bacterium]
MMKAVLVGILLAMGLSMAACTNRALSLMDTSPIHGNTHQFEVLKDGKVVYWPEE